MDTYPRATWRLIYSPPFDGPTNMAIDDAIHLAVADGLVPPTLRLYAWDPPCLSLGRNQSMEEIDTSALEVTGYGLVRRPTGGQAILHIDELTYSVSALLSDPRVRGSVLESCQSLSRGLLQALDDLGTEGATALRKEHRPSPAATICFETTADFEVAVKGKKLIGSAQMRTQRALLQHGTLPLYGDIARICKYLQGEVNPQRVRQRAATLEQLLERSLPWEKVAGAVAQGFAKALDLSLEPGKLTPAELSRVDELRAEKYAAHSWTARL